VSAEHSPIGASGMHRWSRCPGAVRLCEGLPEAKSAYAEEGTRAHELAARQLSGQPALAAVEDADLLEAVSVYTRWVGAERQGGELHIEVRFDLGAVHPGLFGTADCVIWRPDDKRLIVADYKHGAGVPVEVENNPQLRYYALGALLNLRYPAATVAMVVIQPRCPHPDGAIRVEVVDVVDLLDFASELKAFAVATETPDAPLVPGEHCRWCPAAAVCPALADRTQALAKIEFAPALSYDPVALARALDARAVVRAWLEALDQFAYAEAEAGRCPPGYKLVEKRATRKWINETTALEALHPFFATRDMMFEPRALLSPARMEKVMPKSARPVLDGLVTKESAGHALVPDTDKRPAVRRSAVEDFRAPNTDGTGGTDG